MRTLVIALRVTVLTLVVTGLVYPLVGLGVGALFTPQAGGSLVRDGHGIVVGSALIGQRWTRAAYFQGRPSAGDYDGAASGGSNLGPTSKKLRDRTDAERARLEHENPGEGPVPTELLAASASGLDPHISPASARWQARRVATARGLTVSRVDAAIDPLVEPRTLGFLGEPRVNVLLLNRALDAQFGTQAR